MLFNVKNLTSVINIDMINNNKVNKDGNLSLWRICKTSLRLIPKVNCKRLGSMNKEFSWACPRSVNLEIMEVRFLWMII